MSSISITCISYLDTENVGFVYILLKVVMKIKI